MKMEVLSGSQLVGSLISIQVFTYIICIFSQACRGPLRIPPRLLWGSGLPQPRARVKVLEAVNGETQGHLSHVVD